VGVKRLAQLVRRLIAQPVCSVEQNLDCTLWIVRGRSAEVIRRGERND